MTGPRSMDGRSKMAAAFRESCYLCGKIFDSLRDGRNIFIKSIGKFMPVCGEMHKGISTEEEIAK